MSWEGEGEKRSVTIKCLLKVEMKILKNLCWIWYISDPLLQNVIGIYLKHFFFSGFECLVLTVSHFIWCFMVAYSYTSLFITMRKSKWTKASCFKLKALFYLPPPPKKCWREGLLLWWEKLNNLLFSSTLNNFPPPSLATTTPPNQLFTEAYSWGHN